MKSFLLIVFLAGLAWFGYSKHTISTRPDAAASRSTRPEAHFSPAPGQTGAAAFQCDGRTHCSQMTSCAEATYFLQHCPNTQMDGNHDGEPCEQQWCN